MNCNTCKHYDRSKYPYHCKLANKDERFCNDCIHGIFHYEPKDEYVETEIDCAKIIADEYAKWSEEHKEEIRKPRINWWATICCWLVLLTCIAVLILDVYIIVVSIINGTFNIFTAILLVALVFSFSAIIIGFKYLAYPKYKY